MTKYNNILRNRPIHTVKDNPTKVVIKLISSMSDNSHTFTFLKREDNTFSLSTHGHSFKNFGITRFSKEKLEIEATEGYWFYIFTMIETGTSLIESVKSY